MASMEAGLLVLTSFVAGIVAHAVWQMHRGATQVGGVNKGGTVPSQDEQGSAPHPHDSSEVKHHEASHANQPIPLPPSPALPPLLSTTSSPMASLSVPADVTISHPLSPSPSPNPGGHVASPMHTPNMLLTPPPEAWIGQPEETLAKAGATDSWGEAVDRIEGEEGEHI